jgi:hypothetical protein
MSIKNRNSYCSLLSSEEGKAEVEPELASKIDQGNVIDNDNKSSSNRPSSLVRFKVEILSTLNLLIYRLVRIDMVSVNK